MIEKYNYEPESMSFMDGFTHMHNRLTYRMKYDKKKAIHFLRKEILKDKEDQIDYVLVGLDGDWEQCCDLIYKDGKWQKPDFHDNSDWAKPIMIIYYKDDSNKVFEVWSKEE